MGVDNSSFHTILPFSLILAAGIVYIVYLILITKNKDSHQDNDEHLGI